VPAILKPVELWTGKQLFSCMVRPNVRCRVFVNVAINEKQYTGRGAAMCPRDGHVSFVNSELVSGRIGKGVLGGNKKGLFGTLNSQYGPLAAGARVWERSICKLARRTRSLTPCTRLAPHSSHTRHLPHRPAFPDP